MPKWIHDRADHIRGKNPGMPKSESFAIATQQAYAAGKAPKSHGTSEGRQTAHKKYDEGKSHYKKVADPKNKSKSAGLSLEMFLGFSDELKKIATTTPTTASSAAQVTKAVGQAPKLPKLTSKPQMPPETSPVQDHIGSMKANPPPPVRL